MISPSNPNICLRLSVLFVAHVFLISSTSAQDVSEPEPPDQRIASVQFAGNTLFTDFQLQTLTRTKANREFLQIPGFRWWLWLYQLGAPGKTIFGRALMSTGEPPAAYQQEIVDADIERLRLFYLQEGFRRVDVNAEVVAHDKSPWVTVRFVIEKGPPTYIRKLEFTGVDAISGQVRSRISTESLIADADDVARSPNRYSEPLLIEERTRIVNVLRNSGYATVTRDSIRAIVFPFSPDSFDVTLTIGAGERYRFSDVAIAVQGPEQSEKARSDTLRTIVVDDGESLAFVTADYQYESQLESSLLRRSLRFRPGEWFDQSQLTATKQRLEASGIFTYTNIQSESIVDTLSGSPALPTEIELRTRRRHQIRLETFMLQRGGVLGGADTELGTGIGMSYRNLNTLGGGENFRLRASGSIAADSDFRLFTSTQGEVSATILYPYLIFPFRGIDNRISLFDSRSRFSVTLLAARRDQLKLVIRGRGNMRFRLELQHTPTIASLVDVIDLSVSNPDTIRGFNEEFLEPLLASIGDDPLQRARILEDYTSPQVNNALRYTFRSTNVNPLRREEGYSYDLSGEVGGTLPSFLDRYVFTPDSVEGSLPALPFFGSSETDPRLIYRPYVRFVTDLRQYRRMNRVTVVAFRALGGVVHPTGGSPVAPFDKRFFSGGAFSVRGWQLGELGPGAAELGSTGSTSSTETTNILGGDIKLESSVEMRTTMFTNVLAADWIFALFGDAGNIWFGPRNPGIETDDDDVDGQFRLGSVYKEIGVGSGLGIRIAWEYFIARIDIGYKVYDPSRSVRGFYPDGFSDPVLHFGIGHTF
ncbi:MAG: BamA/TamA family outer membrane protein [Rhodothermales bacterium]|nr:BamA/TamA family outer membrane protein [Rhodothermales bacterium]